MCVDFVKTVPVVTANVVSASCQRLLGHRLTGADEGAGIAAGDASTFAGTDP